MSSTHTQRTDSCICVAASITKCHKIYAWNMLLGMSSRNLLGSKIGCCMSSLGPITTNRIFRRLVYGFWSPWPYTITRRIVNMSKGNCLTPAREVSQMAVGPGNATRKAQKCIEINRKMRMRSACEDVVARRISSETKSCFYQLSKILRHFVTELLSRRGISPSRKFSR